MASEITTPLDDFYIRFEKSVRDYANTVVKHAAEQLRAGKFQFRRVTADMITGHAKFMILINRSVNGYARQMSGPTGSSYDRWGRAIENSARDRWFAVQRDGSQRGRKTFLARGYPAQDRLSR